MNKVRKALSILLIMTMVLSYGSSISFIAGYGTAYAGTGSETAEDASEGSGDAETASEESGESKLKASEVEAQEAEEAEEKVEEPAEEPAAKEEPEEATEEAVPEEKTKDEDPSDSGSYEDPVPEDLSSGSEEEITKDEESGAKESADEEKAAELKDRKFVVTAKRETTYVEKNGKKQESEALERVQNFWKSLSGHKAELMENGEDDPLTLTISGKLPEDITAEAKYIEFDESKKYEADKESALFGIEIKLKDAKGKNYVPENPISVKIEGDRIRKAANADDSILIYSYDENENRIKKAENAGDDIYAADVLVYKSKAVLKAEAEAGDSDDADAYPAYELYDSGKEYKKYEDAVRYSEDGEGFSVTKKDALKFDYAYGYSLDSESKGDDIYADSASFVLSVKKHQDEEAEGEAADGQDTESAEKAGEEAAEGEDDEDADTQADESADGQDDEGTDKQDAESDDGQDAEAAEESGDEAGGDDAAGSGDEAAVDADSSETGEEEADEQSAGVVAEDLSKAGDPAGDSADTEDPKSEAGSGTLTATDNKTYKVTVSYGADAGLPEGLELDVQVIKAGSSNYDGYVDKATDAIEKNADDLAFAHVFDITLIDPATGRRYQPDSNVKVTIDLLKEDVGEANTVDVVHFKEGAVQKVLGIGQGTPEVMDSEVNDGSVEFESDGFSVYAVLGYTVDFHWGDYTYNLAGGTEIYLSELLEILGNSDEGKAKEDSEQLLALAKDLSQVKNVVFSDPDLVGIREMEILDSQKLIENDYDEQLIEETHTDWLLISKAPFETEETLTICLKNGQKIEITVTDIVYGDDAGETVTKGIGRNVTADGVTYLLSNAGTANGTARVTGMTAGCTIHDTIIYNGRRYVTENVREAEGTLTRNKNKMDWDVIHKIATYGFDLPEIVQDPGDPTSGDASYKIGENNDGNYKVWKKAEYNASTNSIEYTLKYFQAMKKDVPLDFIFIYDDSASMYSGNRTSGGITLCEAQTTRVLILAAAKALFNKGSAEGYDINIYLGGASSGHTDFSGALTSYDAVEEYLATYRSGTTRHATGVSNALTLARTSKGSSRNPVVIYLSDFHQPGTLGTAGINNANSLHAIAPVYALGTDTGYRYTTNNATRYIPSGSGYYRTMRDIGGGIEELEKIIKEAIGYYMQDPLTVTDELSEPLSGVTATGASGEGSQSPSAGRVNWSLGAQDPLLGAGTVYTETFNVKLDDSKVYSGGLPTNKNVLVKQGNTEVNKITESPITTASIKFNLGRLNQDGTTRPLSVTGVKFTLTEIPSSGSTGTPQTKDYTTTSGAFEIPYSDFTFAPGTTYTLTQDQTTTASLITDSDAVTLANPMTWTLKVNNDYTITATKDGADTDVTISGGKFNLWNREFTNPPLTKIYVKKNWDSSVSDSLKQPVSFTVYGLNGTEKIELPAYEHDDDNTRAARIANKQVTKLTVDDVDIDNTPYTKAVWVPQFVVSGSNTILFKDGDNYYYTIGEADLANPTDDPDDDIIGAPGKWNDALITNQTKTEQGELITPAVPARNKETTNGNQVAYLQFNPTYDPESESSYFKILYNVEVRGWYLNSVDISYEYDGVTYETTVNVTNMNGVGNQTPRALYGYSQGYYIPNGNSSARVKFETELPAGVVPSNIQVTGGRVQYVTYGSFLVFFTGWNRENSRDVPSSWFSNPTIIRSTTASPTITATTTTEKATNPGTPAVYEQLNFPVLNLTNSFTTYKVLTINSEFTDSTRDSASITDISAVGYEIVDGSGNVVAIPEASVVTAEGNTKSGFVKVYVPKDKTYTVRQTYYKLSDGTTVNAHGGEFDPFVITSAFSSTSDANKCTASGVAASMNGEASSNGEVTFTNDRKMFPVTVKATWNPDLTDSDIDTQVKTNGIPYEIKWGDAATQKLTDDVKEADVIDPEKWIKQYTDIPTYTIKGNETECSINSTADPHPDYETAVEREESGNELLFNINNTIKKGEITIGKVWDVEQFEEQADPQKMGPETPASITVQVKRADGATFTWTEKDQNDDIVTNTGTEATLVINEAGGWSAKIGGLDIRRNYIVTETMIGNQAVADTSYTQTYDVTEFDTTGNPVSSSSKPATVGPDNFGEDGAIVNITNTMRPIARVSTDNGATWTYYEALITGNYGGKDTVGALTYASTLTGDVIIETLKQGRQDDGTDDTKFDGDTQGRYTLTEGITFNNNANITLRTAESVGDPSVLTRGYSGVSLFTLNGSGTAFTTQNIVLDGGYLLETPLTCSGNGGIVKVSAGSLTVGSDTLMRNSYASKGGAVAVEGAGTLSMNGSEVRDCFANPSNGQGGSIYFDSTGTMTLTDATIDGRYSSAVPSDQKNAQDGGGIYVTKNSTSVNITGCTFQNCTATNSAGGMQSSSAFTVSNTSFTNCTANKGGGVNIFYDNKNLTGTFTNCIFSDCMTNENGGAIRNNNGNSLTVSGGKIENCTAKSKGGGIYSTKEVILENGLIISGCTANSQGGGVYAGGNITLKGGVTITGNTVSQGVSNGAGIYIANGKKLILGGSDVSSEESRVTGNKTNNSNSPSDVRLSENSNAENSSNSVDIKSHLGDNCLIKVANANYYETVFGDTSDPNDDTFNVDGVAVADRKIISDDEYLYAVYTDDSKTKIRWFGIIVCKITDEEGTLLYLPNGRQAIFTSVKQAFDSVDKNNPGLKYKDGSSWIPYNEKEYWVKMVVPYFENPESIDEQHSGNVYTLTTAGKNDADWPFRDKNLLGTNGSTYDYDYPVDQSNGVSMLKRKDNGIFTNNMFTVKAGVTLNLTDIVIDGNKEKVTATDSGGLIQVKNGDDARLNIKSGAILQNSKTGQGNKGGSGGAISLMKGVVTLEGGTIRGCEATNSGAAITMSGGTLKITGGTIKDNSSSNNGGAISVSGGSAEMTGGAIKDNTASNNGGGVFITESAQFTMTGGEISGNSAKQGGGVFINSANGQKFGTMKLSGGKIKGNTASAYGGGIFVQPYGVLEISGALDFGGTGIGSDGNLDFTGANIAKRETDNDSRMKEDARNGGMQYPIVSDSKRWARQDIYLNGKANAGDILRNIVITGNLTGPEGSIWVWAKEANHYGKEKQFAVLDRTDISGLGVFRNARHDKLTAGEDALSEYLTGVLSDEDTTKLNVYWGNPIKGSRKVVIRKVNGDYEPLSGGKFTVRKGSNNTGTVVKVDNVDLVDLPAKASGVIWIGNLPLGTYFIEEVEKPDGASAKRDYILIITEASISFEPAA